MTATEPRLIRRLCLQIQTETDSDKFTKLALELYALLDRNKGDERGPSAHEVNGNRQANGHNPYLIFARAEWLTDLLDSTIAATGADFGDVQLFDSSARVENCGAAWLRK